jgi:hypothetical protein
MDNIKKDLWETGWQGVNRIQLAQNINRRWVVVNTEINLQILQKARNFLTSSTYHELLK